MILQVTEDRRSIVLTVGGVDPLDRDDSGYNHRNPLIKPDRLEVLLINGEFRSAKVSGLTMKRAGTPGIYRASRTWLGDDGLSVAPEWVRNAVDRAIKGDWSW